MRPITFLAVLSLLLASGGCGTDNQRSAPAASSAPPASPPSTPSETAGAVVPSEGLTEYRQRANSDDAQSIEEAAFHGIARALVIRHVEPNKLAVGGREFRVKRNPVGPGCLVYDPRTRFSGVERNLLWLVVDETTAYALNSPSKMVTPALKWPRDDGVDIPSTSELVAYVFEGQPISAPPSPKQAPQAAKGTFTVAEYRIYRDVMDAPMSIPETEAVRRAATSHGVTAAEAKTIVDKVQRILHANKWYGSAASEMKHASDWNGETR